MYSVEGKKGVKIYKRKLEAFMDCNGGSQKGDRFVQMQSNEERTLRNECILSICSIELVILPIV